MKYHDIVKLHDMGLITDDQRQKIITTLNLKEDGGGKLLMVFSTIGAVLVVTGIILLISANWEDIPRFVKIASAIGLMLGAWAAGWFLREVQGVYKKAGEALYLVGAGLWLANIALIGQIYHLSSRPSNAFLLWLAGIAATPWILRSKALFVLMLGAFGIWLGVDMNAPSGIFGSNWDEAQLVVYGLCGLAVLGWGGMMRGTRWDEFSGAAEKTGLLALMIFAYPLCWGEFYHRHFDWEPMSLALLIVLSVGAVAMLAKGLYRRDLALDRQWRWTWGITLSAIGALFWVWLVASGNRDTGFYYWRHGNGTNWLMSIGLFVAALLQVQVGIALASRFMVNLAVLMMGLVILATYVTLFGSMATTGLMFVVSGLFLIGFGIYLERKRRNFIARIRANAKAGNLQPSN